MKTKQTTIYILVLIFIILAAVTAVGEEPTSADASIANEVLEGVL